MWTTYLEIYKHIFRYLNCKICVNYNTVLNIIESYKNLAKFKRIS